MYALATDVAQLMNAGNGSDFVHFVEKNDALLRTLHVVVGVLKKLGDNRLDVFA